MVLSTIYTDDTTSSNATVPATETTVKTTNITKNNFRKVIIDGLVEILQTASSTAQAVTFKIKNGSTVLKTYTYATKAVLEQTNVVPLRYAGEVREGGAITISIQGAAADANTNYKYVSLYIFAEA